MKKTILLLTTMAWTLSLTSSVSLGQVGLIPGANDPSKADLKVMTDNRSLVSTKVDPFKGEAEGYIVGIDEGSFDINELKLFMAELRGSIKSAFSHGHPAETQYNMVVTASAPVTVKSNIPKHKKRSRRAQSKNYQQKI